MLWQLALQDDKKKKYTICTALLKTTKAAVSITVWARFMVFGITLFYNLFHDGGLRSHIRLSHSSCANKLNCVCV